jgi:hypothetical protein
LCSSSDPN